MCVLECGCYSGRGTDRKELEKRIHGEVECEGVGATIAHSITAPLAPTNYEEFTSPALNGLFLNG
jgi:hypothetical protein